MASNVDPSTLNETRLFEGLNPEQIEELTPLLHRKTFPPGASMMTADQPGEAIYLILEGTVKVHVHRTDGSEVILAFLGPGDTVGEMSLVDSSLRSANAVTMEECTCLWLDRASFQRCLQTMNGLACNLLRLITARLRLADEQIQALSTLDVSGRVARQLMSFVKQYGHPLEGGATRINLRLTQKDIAELVGASRERVNQVMMDFKQRSFVSVDQDQRISIQNLDALASCCRMSE